MSKESELTQAARERADKRIADAIGELHRAAHDIGKKHGIPEGISGHSIDELLGRISYIPSMARDLRRALALELTKQEISAVMGADDEKPAPAAAAKSAPKPIEPSQIPDTIPAGLDVSDLSGITVQTVKALKAAGLNTVGDIVQIPDEHLLKILGGGQAGQKNLGAVRKAVAGAKPKA